VGGGAARTRAGLAHSHLLSHMFHFRFLRLFLLFYSIIYIFRGRGVPIALPPPPPPLPLPPVRDVFEFEAVSRRQPLVHPPTLGGWRRGKGRAALPAAVRDAAIHRLQADHLRTPVWGGGGERGGYGAVRSWGGCLRVNLAPERCARRKSCWEGPRSNGATELTCDPKCPRLRPSSQRLPLVSPRRGGGRGTTLGL